jgi:hypothetical protein
VKCYVYEWCSAPEFNPRGGLVCIRTYPSGQEARADYALLKERELTRRAQYKTENRHDDPFPHYHVVSHRDPSK